MKVIFVSGAYRSDSENGVFMNIMKAREAAVSLWHEGWAVICSHTNSMFMGTSRPDTIFLDGDLEILRRCDAVFALDNWGESEGARTEVALAHTLELPVYYQRSGIPTPSGCIMKTCKCTRPKWDYDEEEHIKTCTYCAATVKLGSKPPQDEHPKFPFKNMFTEGKREYRGGINKPRAAE